MKFKIDENLPVELAALLYEAGHNAETVYHEQLAGCSDLVLIDTCLREGRVLITLDLDFSDIRSYPPEMYQGIIVLRLIDQSRRSVIKAFQKVLPFMEREPLSGCLWIIDEKKIRLRGGEGEALW